MQKTTLEAASSPATNSSSMNMVDNIHLEGAREALMRGIKKASDAIAGTLGPTGYSIIVEDNLYPGHFVGDDGWAALKKIKLADPLEQRGVELLKESVERSNKQSGDGSTTATILTAAILEEGLKENVHGQAIKKSLDVCISIIEASLDTQTTLISPAEVGQVAAISSGDETVGTLIQEIYTKIGKEGIIELDLSQTPDTHYDIVEGVRLHNCGYMYPYMATGSKKAVYKNPKILITKQKIGNLNQIDPIFKSLSTGGTTELVIFCDEIDIRVSETLAMAAQQGAFKTLVIKAPTLWKDWLFEDFAAITGARIIDPATGTSLERFSLNHLGSCEKIITSEDETLVLGTKDISEHIAELMEAGKTDDQQKLRAGWLRTKTAILKVGANSESELSLKRLKIEDARNAAYQALQSGIVVGAGKALVNAIEKLPDTIGGNILRKALIAPFVQLQKNFGQDDIDTTNVVDPVAVPKNAVKNAISVAGTILTSNCVITLYKPEING